jgi:hypothetical protein
VKVSGENATEGEYVLDPVEEPTGANSPVSSVTGSQLALLKQVQIVPAPALPSIGKLAARGPAGDSDPARVRPPTASLRPQQGAPEAPVDALFASWSGFADAALALAVENASRRRD